MSTLLNITNSLQNFQNNIQNTLSDRLTSINNSVSRAVTSNGSTILSQNLLNQIRSLTQKYKVSLESTFSTEENVNGNRGNRVLFTNVYAGEDYLTLSEKLTNLQTSDIHKIILQGKFLNGLLGSTEPVLPMAFNIVYPETAQSLNPLTISQPLYLFINPNSWQRNSNKILAKNYIRNGIKTERWGEELEQISASGTCAAFYTQETGLTRFYRNQTPGFRNLLELIQVYRNNGCIYGRGYKGNDKSPSSNNRILDVGFVEILYGYELFRGTFDSFTLTEDASKPFNVEYSFTFNCSTVVSIYDILNQSSDSYNLSNGVSIVDGTYSQEEIVQIQEGQQNQLNSDQSSQSNITQNKNLLNRTNSNLNKGNKFSLFSIK